MSYILDALRKADAERDRGHVPGIHAQPSFGGAAPAARAATTRPGLWVAIALGVLLIAALAWWLGGGGASRVAEAPSPASVIRQAPTAPPPVIAGPAPAAALPAAPLVTASMPLASAVVVPKAEAAREPRKAKPAATVPAANAAPAPAAPEPKPAAVAEKVYSIAELPDEIRRQLPNVAVGGSVYSKTPADRILIINGQVLHEGEVIAPDLVLQQIRLKGALLNFKGYRYTIAF
jgi:general secretion pathway protein B